MPLPPDRVDLLFIIRLCVSLLMHARDVTDTKQGVSDWGAALTLVDIRGHLAIAQDLSITLVNRRILIFMGVCSSTLEGSDLLLVSQLPLVACD